MTYSNFALKSVYYTTALSTVTIGASIATYFGLQLSDRLLGTSYGGYLEETTDKILNRESLKIESPSKNVADILYNSTSVYYNDDNNQESVQKNIKVIHNIYQNFEKDSVMKYFAYVNALNAKDNEDAVFGFKVAQFHYLPFDSLIWEMIGQNKHVYLS